MIRTLTVCLVATVSLAAAPAPGAVGQKPRVVVLDEAPFTVRGLNFRAAERVRVVVRVDGTAYSRRVTTTERGRFTVRFGTIEVGACTGYVVSATGNKGSRAGLKFVPECPAP